MRQIMSSSAIKKCEATIAQSPEMEYTDTKQPESSSRQVVLTAGIQESS